MHGKYLHNAKHIVINLDFDIQTPHQMTFWGTGHGGKRGSISHRNGRSYLKSPVQSIPQSVSKFLAVVENMQAPKHFHKDRRTLLS